jgi:hypothetical protein
MTLRQLYYQLVGRNVIPNEERAYKNLSVVLTNARMAGLVDWDAIEDRHRRPIFPLEFSSIEERIETAVQNYRLDRWEGQPVYAELLCEKNALSNIFAPIADEFHAVYLANVGYLSATTMRDCAQRFIGARERGQEPIVFYIGDLDPSGEDMVRDIRDRLDEFGADVDVRKLALNLDQVQEHRLPPNPAKTDDKRAPRFIDKFGEFSWEADALPPDVLAAAARDAFVEVIDQDALDEVLEQEEADKERLRGLLS